jgi:threonine synthase
MDILVSSNLERLLFEASGRDPRRVASLMADLATKGHYSLSPGEFAPLSDFSGGAADEAEAAAEIRRVFRESGYLLDPHTATASAVAHRQRGVDRPMLVAATASPFKFPSTVASALGLELEGDEFELIGRLAQAAGLSVPPQLAGLRGASEVHRQHLGPEEMEAAILDWLEKSPC